MVSPGEAVSPRTIHGTEGVPQGASTRVKFVLRDKDKWVNIDEFSVRPTEHSIIRRKTEEHINRGQFLFNLEFWSLHPLEYLNVTVASGTNTIFLIPAGRVHIT